MNERDQELWDKSTTWDSADDGRGGLKIRTSVAKFAELIRADEREACAKVCDDIDAEYEAVCQETSILCSQLIRARGTK